MGRGDGLRKRIDNIEKSAGQDADRLTDLLTRPVGMGETTRDTGDAHLDLCLVSETRRNAGDVGYARRMAHNPAATVHAQPAHVIPHLLPVLARLVARRGG
jgi:hypothetical protein